MIIWKGRGILIPLFFIGGILGGMMASSLFSEGSNIPMLLGFWLGTGFVWVFALTDLGRSTSQTLIDPQTMRPVVMEKAHSLYFLPPKAWAVLATVFVAVMTFTSLTEDNESAAADHEASQAFKTADHFLSGRGPVTTSGNTPEAAEIAKAIASMAKEVRADVIGKKGSSPIADFSAYAHKTRTQCVVLMRVPDLRSFTDEAKDIMVQVAWLSAQKVIGESAPETQSLVVGVRGTILYERALKGTLVEIDPEEPLAGVTEEIKTSKARDFLAAHFSVEEESAEAIAALDSKDSADAPSKTPVPQDESGKAVPPSAPPEQSAPMPEPAPVNEEAGKLAKPTMPEPAPALPTNLRDWKDASGRPLKASLVRFVDDVQTIGEFKREDGSLFEIPLERFSEEDKAFLNELKTK